MSRRGTRGCSPPRVIDRLRAVSSAIVALALLTALSLSITQGVQSSQGNRQAESCEQRQRDDGPVVDQVDATGSGLACAFQIVGEARIFKALQSLPAIGSLHHLFGDVAS